MGLRLSIANHVIHKCNEVIAYFDLNYTPPIIVPFDLKERSFSDLTEEERGLIIRYVLFHYKL